MTFRKFNHRDVLSILRYVGVEKYLLEPVAYLKMNPRVVLGL